MPGLLHFAVIRGSVGEWRRHQVSRQQNQNQPWGTHIYTVLKWVISGTVLIAFDSERDMKGTGHGPGPQPTNWSPNRATPFSTISTAASGKLSWKVFPMEACCKCSWQVCISSFINANLEIYHIIRRYHKRVQTYKQVKHMIWQITYLRILSDIYKPSTFNAACSKTGTCQKIIPGPLTPIIPYLYYGHVFTSSLGFTETGCFLLFTQDWMKHKFFVSFQEPKIQWERFANLKVWFSLTNLKMPQREHVGRIFFVHHDLIDGIKSRRFALEYKISCLQK